MTEIIFGALCVILGILINEQFRRISRIETYSSQIFEKRLLKYEELMKLMLDGFKTADYVMENIDLTEEKRHEMISTVVLSIAKFTDADTFFIDQDLGAHCVATFMGAEDIQKIQDDSKRKKEKQKIISSCNDAIRMIREDSGIADIDKFYKRMTRPKLNSPVIELIKKYREHQK